MRTFTVTMANAQIRTSAQIRNARPAGDATKPAKTLWTRKLALPDAKRPRRTHAVSHMHTCRFRDLAVIASIFVASAI